MIEKTRAAIDDLCVKIENLRRFPIIETVRDNIEDDIMIRLIAAHREGDDVAGIQLLNHADRLVERLMMSEFAEKDEVFLAEIALDEAVAAERAEMIEARGGDSV